MSEFPNTALPKTKSPDMGPRKLNSDFYMPTLMYHHVSPDAAGPISVTPELFEAQIAGLYDAGWQAISVHNVLELMARNEAFPAKRFVLTFDDAYEDVYSYAWPVLRGFQATSCVYVVTGYIGHFDSWNHRADTFSRHMSWEQLAQLLATGFELGCHTKTHQCLVKLDDRWLDDEVLGAKHDLEKGLASQIDLFCYPYGRFDHRVRSCVAQHYLHAFGVEEGAITWDSDCWSVRRIYIGPKHSPSAVLRAVQHFSDDHGSDTMPPKDMRKWIG